MRIVEESANRSSVAKVIVHSRCCLMQRNVRFVRKLAFENLESRRVLCAFTASPAAEKSVARIESFGPIEVQPLSQASVAVSSESNAISATSSPDIQPIVADTVFANSGWTQPARLDLTFAASQVVDSTRSSAETEIFALGRMSDRLLSLTSGEPSVNSDLDPSTFLIAQGIQPTVTVGEGEGEEGYGQPGDPDTSPPVLLEFNAVRTPDAVLFYGRVEDNMGTEGLVVSFGGLLAGHSCMASADGTFLYMVVLGPGEYGTITAIAQDAAENVSNLLYVVV